MYPNYGDWLLKSCRRVAFKPRIVKEADGAATALAFVATGLGVAVISESLQKIPAKDVIFRDLVPEDRAWVPVGAAWKPEALTAPVASRFIDVLAQTCAGYGSFGVGLSDLLVNGANRSIGIGRMVVVLCSLEISFIVCKKRSCRAIGCAEIIDAACTSFSAA
jgi:LysR substrate binding domain